MNPIKQIFILVFGRFKTGTYIDLLYNIIRIIYFIILLPSFLMAILIFIRSGFGEEKGKVGVVKKALLHMAMLFWSIIGWGVIIGIITGEYR